MRKQGALKNLNNGKDRFELSYDTFCSYFSIASVVNSGILETKFNRT